MDREAQWSAWMVAANRGDETAYRRLLSSLAEALRGVCRRGLERAGRSGSDAEDLVQEILIALHQKRHTWNPDQPLGPWVYAIARHKLVDALRRKSGMRDVCIDTLAETFALPEPRLDRWDLDRLSRLLTARQKEVVLSLAVHGYTTREVADRLSMTDGAVRVTFHRALQSLSALVRSKA
jgi:RNA polymerase sigma-70 factor (ECF subfamily)